MYSSLFAFFLLQKQWFRSAKSIVMLDITIDFELLSAFFEPLIPFFSEASD